jgi:hypothetical protein
MYQTGSQNGRKNIATAPDPVMAGSSILSMVAVKMLTFYLLNEAKSLVGLSACDSIRIEFLTFLPVF